MEQFLVQSVVMNDKKDTVDTEPRLIDETPATMNASKKIAPDPTQKNTLANTDASKQNTDLNTQGKDTTRGEFLQQVSNLPDEILALPRFVNSGNHGNLKAPFDGWNRPENQKLYSELNGIIGFVASTVDDDSLIFFDFDHVLNDQGEFINANAEKWFNYLHAGEYFCELSQSRKGLHMFAAPSIGKFLKGRRELDFGDGAKLEIFYGTNKFCLVTGNPFRCEPKSHIAQSEVADEMFQALLDEIKKRQPADTSQKNSTRPAPMNAADNPDYDAFRANIMIRDFIPLKDLSGDDWLAVISALKNLNFSYEEVDRLNQGGAHYDEKENKARWDSLKDTSFGIETLHGIAKRFGYAERAARRQWYELHPNLKPSAAKKVDIDEETKSELDDAIIFLQSLTPDNFTADDAHNSQTIRYLALAQLHGFSSVAENFFCILKNAKKAANNRLKESETTLTAKLASEEINELNAIIGINIKSLRDRVDREVTALDKAHATFLKGKRQKALQKRIEQKRAAQAERIVNAQNRLDELRAMEPSPERDAEMIELIRNSCEWKHDKYDRPISIKATATNADIIFTYDPNLDNLVGYDEFQQAYVFLKTPPWNKKGKKFDEWKDSDDAQHRTYLRRVYTEFSGKNLVDDWLTEYAMRRSFHEVKEFFRNLPKWDGKPRAETLFIKFLKAEDSPYVREVTLNWLTAAVARIFHPGCDYQLAPILLGDQGIGKSYLVSKIFGKWYGSLIDDVSDPHAVDAIQKLWGVEIKEMAAMKKDIDANKRFIDAAEDTRRRAYERRPTKIKRHCVFIITTNNKLCLTDLTGNRRYPVIVCHGKPREYVTGLTDKYIAQVWAEVFQHCQELFKDGFDNSKLELSKDAQIQSDETAEQFTRDDLTEEIKSFLDIKIPPQIIWKLLSKEERRKFFDTNSFSIELEDLNAKFRNSAGKHYDKLFPDYEKACKVKNGIVRKINRPTKDGGSAWYLVFYGSEYRKHICPAEILHECFNKTDRRVSIPKILESLNRIDGWTQGVRYQKKDPVYNDQKIIFYRDNENQPQ